MADWINLKNSIKSTIKQNGNQEITGALLQSTLLSTVDNVNNDKFDVANVVQSTGTATNKVMSQATASDELNKINSRINSSTVVLGTKKTKLFGFYGFLKYSSGDLQRQDLHMWSTTDYITVSAGQTFDAYLPAYNSNVAVIGCYDSSFTYLEDKSIIGTDLYSGTFTVPDGVSYIRFSGPTSTSYISSTSGDNIVMTVANAVGLISQQTMSDAVFWNPTFFASEKLGNWSSKLGATVSFNDDDKCIDVTTSSLYAGISTKVAYSLGTKAVITFEAKGVSGNFSKIGVSFALASSTAENTKIIPLTSEWEYYTFAFEATSFSAEATRGITIIDYLENNTTSFKIRNCTLITSTDNSPLFVPFSIIAENSTVKTKVADVETKVANVETRVANVETKVTDTVFDEGTDSLNAAYIENGLADFGLPSWVGKVEKRTTDLIPSINNAGQAYILEDGDSYELRIVKDALSIVGLPITVKKENSISETKTFSMIHFGDSITVGVGSSPNYVERLKTLLETDGHTISKQTNKGVSGTTAEGINSIYKSMNADPHDIATLMIGMNDPERWLSDKNKDYKTEGLKSREFRLWYKENLAAAINLIIEKTSCSKFFLIVPYLPTTTTSSSWPLRSIVTQEVIAAQSISNIIHLCRADYYVPNIKTYIPDGIHANNEGAQLLAQGLRNEMTFRI